MLSNQIADNEIPICLAYNQFHYEAFIPDSDEDILKTIQLKQEIINGTYSLKMEDVFAMTNQEESFESSNNPSYAQVVKKTNLSNIQVENSYQKKKLNIVEGDQEQLSSSSKTLGGKGRTKEEEQEFKKLMERKR